MTTDLEDKVYALQARLDNLVSSGAMGGGAVPLVGVKPGGSTFTSRANTTTLTIDPHLQVPVVAGGIYKVDCRIIYSGGASNSSGFTFTLLGPSGTEIDWYIPEMTSTGAAGWFFGVTSYFAPTQDAYTNGTASTSTTGLAIQGTAYIGGSSGTLGLYWAQTTSTATTTRIWSGSHLLLTKIG
jgi:hypothetical protein